MIYLEKTSKYVSPEIEIVTFEFEESIASSGAALFDEVWDGFGE